MLREVESGVFIPEIGDLIFEKSNAVPSDFCDYLIEKFENDTENQIIGLTGVAGDCVLDSNIKKTTDIILNPNEKWHDDIDSFLKEYVTPSVEEYYDNLGNIGKSLLDCSINYESIVMARYNIGDKFEWHFDQASGTGDRVFQVIAYLNTTEGGGETDYAVFNKKIKPEKGKIIIAPSSFPFFHKSHPVTDGKKYNIIMQLRFESI